MELAQLDGGGGKEEEDDEEEDEEEEEEEEKTCGLRNQMRFSRCGNCEVKGGQGKGKGKGKAPARPVVPEARGHP